MSRVALARRLLAALTESGRPAQCWEASAATFSSHQAPTSQAASPTPMPQQPASATMLGSKPQHRRMAHHSAERTTWGSLALHAPGSMHRHLSTTPSASSAAAAGGGSSPQPPAGGSGSGSGDDGTIKVTLQDALSRLVEAAVKRIEESDPDGAISILKEGIKEFEPVFGGSPEVGEMHNQVAFILFYNGKPDEASQHAEVALETTLKIFGPKGRLTGHRLLRLGAIRFAQGSLGEASQLLAQCMEALSEDPSRYEADFYTALVEVAAATSAAQVRQNDERLVAAVRRLKQTFGAESMLLGIGFSQHDRLLNQALAAQTPDVLLCEALFKQHAKMVEELDPQGEDLAITHYKMGTFFYASDMLPDAGQHVQKAASIMRARYPEEHDLVVMCKHRLGMVCAASGDHRSAAQMLGATKAHYDSQESTRALAQEADLGLAMAKYRSMDPTRVDAATRQAALLDVQSKVEGLGNTIGPNHMLVQGAMRHFAQMSATAKW